MCFRSARWRCVPSQLRVGSRWFTRRRALSVSPRFLTCVSFCTSRRAAASPPLRKTASGPPRRRIKRVLSATRVFGILALHNRRSGIIMAESKGALIAKTVQKHAGRAKEKVSVFHLSFSLSLLLSRAHSSNRFFSFAILERSRMSRMTPMRSREAETRRFANENCELELTITSMSRRDARQRHG